MSKRATIHEPLPYRVELAQVQMQRIKVLSCHTTFMSAMNKALKVLNLIDPAATIFVAERQKDGTYAIRHVLDP